jgi:hypothetical protein
MPSQSGDGWVHTGADKEEVGCAERRRVEASSELGPDLERGKEFVEPAGICHVSRRSSLPPSDFEGTEAGSSRVEEG